MYYQLINVSPHCDSLKLHGTRVPCNNIFFVAEQNCNVFTPKRGVAHKRCITKNEDYYLFDRRSIDQKLKTTLHILKMYVHIRF